MRALAIVCLVALAGTTPATADTDRTQAPRSLGVVAVYRGNEANVVSQVPVYRGSAAAPARPTTAPGQAGEALGGRQIWFVNRADDELMNCRNIRTTMVNGRRIVCTRGRLPN